MSHLYSMQRAAMQPNVKVERDFLGPHVDAPASLTHKAILQGDIRSLNEQQKVDWARFLVSLMIRVPAMMGHMRVKGRNILKAGLDDTPDEFQDLRGDAPEETLGEWVEKHHSSWFDDLAVMALPDLVQSPLLNTALLNATWATRRIEKSRFDLLISDNPLIYAGTFETSFLVALPVTPKLVFLAYNEAGTWENLLKRNGESIAQATNLSTVRQAEIYVYATSFQQEVFIKKYLRKQAFDL